MTRSDGKPLPAPTLLWEARLIQAAQHGDRRAQARLLALYEPLVRAVVSGHYLRGGEREDLAQHARLGIVRAIWRWDPARQVPFKPFARLCAMREVRMAYKAAAARKHQPLSAAHPLDHRARHDGHNIPLDQYDELLRRSLAERLVAVRADDDPVAKTLAREQLNDIRDRVPTLSPLERAALALSANDRSYREIAKTLGVSVRAVNNALQRARGKLVGRLAA